MGSATVPNAKPVPMENTDKRSLKTLFKFLFPKKKEKPKNTKQLQIQNEEKQETKPQKDAVAAILENFQKLDLLEKKEEIKNETNEKDDEFENFSYKVVEEARSERIHSQSSDSGYSEKSENSDKPENTDKIDELTDGLKNLNVFADDKKKKLQTVVVKRAPIRSNLTDYVPSTCPYPQRETDPFRQINQINKKTLTGGQVIVNNDQLFPDDLFEINQACRTGQILSQNHVQNFETDINDLFEVISQDTCNGDIQNVCAPISSPVMASQQMADERNAQEDCLNDLEGTNIEYGEVLQLIQDNFALPNAVLNDMLNLPLQYDQIVQETTLQLNDYNILNDTMLSPGYTYPTPPRSENIPSPMSASSSSFYPSNSDYTLSPEMSPIYNSDYEVCQTIPHFEEEKEAIEKRTRTSSISSMTMKQFKDMQKEIAKSFSKRECCQLSRKCCKELFQEHMEKLSVDERKDLCVNVARMDIKNALGVLHHLILNLGRGSEEESLKFCLFSLICERVLGEDIQIFTGDTGLRLLKAVALRRPDQPLLTRYLVQCIRTAIKNNPTLAAGRDCVFHEVDALGDTLVIACARAGDTWSDVLNEIIRPYPDQPPLFKLFHYNADGYTALHVACSQHSASYPRLHIIHVLLEHAGFEVTHGDLRGKDTALHLAVNSVSCDLQLILLMFKQADRKDWKSLAYCPNLSNRTPIDLARVATKSLSRRNYPPEILDFLKKCR